MSAETENQWLRVERAIENMKAQVELSEHETDTVISSSQKNINGLCVHALEEMTDLIRLLNPS